MTAGATYVKDQYSSQKQFLRRAKYVTSALQPIQPAGRAVLQPHATAVWLPVHPSCPRRPQAMKEKHAGLATEI